MSSLTPQSKKQTSNNHMNSLYKPLLKDATIKQPKQGVLRHRPGLKSRGGAGSNAAALSN